MMNRVMTWLAIGIVSAALVLSGSPASHVTLDTSSLAAVTKRVKAIDDSFSPKTITITKGSKIKWVNRGERPHTTTSRKGLWDKELSPGDSYTRRFKKAGTFKYYCRWHSGMKGKIVVTS